MGSSLYSERTRWMKGPSMARVEVNSLKNSTRLLEQNISNTNGDTAVLL